MSENESLEWKPGGISPEEDVFAKKAIVLVASDSGYSGEREDLSGPEAKRILEEHGYTVSRVLLLPDDREKLGDIMAVLADEGEAALVVTSGGTGFSPRDVTPEATMDVVERRTPGISEAIRMHSMQYTDRAMLSRAEAGIRKQTLIVNLPGSPKAVRESLEFILPALEHGIAVLTGAETNCARTGDDK